MLQLELHHFVLDLTGLLVARKGNTRVASTVRNAGRLSSNEEGSELVRRLYPVGGSGTITL